MFPKLKFSLARHGCWSWGKQRSSSQGDKRSCFSSAVWLALMKRFSQQISYCYLITGCQHEIQIADFRWKILSATCQSGQPPIPWKRKTLPLKPKTWRKDIKKILPRWLLPMVRCAPPKPWGGFCKIFFVAISVRLTCADGKNSHILPTGQRYAPSAVNYSAFSAHSA